MAAMNANAIHVSKRNFIEEIWSIVSESGIIRRLFVFGSAVTENCTEESDIDICVDTELEDSNKRLVELYKKISKACDYNCDILKYDKLGEKLKKEIDNKGVIIYDSEQS